MKEICIPKMDSLVSEKTIRKGIENNNLGIIERYTEIPWKNDAKVKRILMNINWNKWHSQYSDIQERLSNGKNIKIVNNTDIWHIFKREGNVSKN